MPLLLANDIDFKTGSLQIGMALLVLKIVFDFLAPIIKRSRPGATDPATEMTATLHAIVKLLEREQIAQAEFRKLIYQQLKDLHVWHNKFDEDGVPVWYVRKGLETAIKELAQNVASQTRIFERLVDRLDMQQREGR